MARIDTAATRHSKEWAVNGKAEHTYIGGSDT